MFKKLKLIWTSLLGFQSQVYMLHRRVDELERLVRERTDMVVDAHFHDTSYIVVMGRYKNRDYVQTFYVPGGDFESLVERLKEMTKFGIVRKVDCPPLMRAVFEREVL